jgi:predicted  nucleic acid-binding Zn-ribbon protein
MVVKIEDVKQENEELKEAYYNLEMKYMKLQKEVVILQRLVDRVRNKENSNIPVKDTKFQGP